MLSIDKYWNLVQKIDQYIAEWNLNPPLKLSCHPGCDECCHSRFSLFAVEVAAIAEALSGRGELPSKRRLNRDNGVCPFLIDQRCIIYDVRPILCRTQGYPFIYQNEEGRTASHICTHNRSSREMSLPSKYVMNLETVNHCLSSINFLYLAELEEAGNVVPARLDILRILDYGKAS